MFKFLKKPKVVDVRMHQYNVFWLLNEEMQRMHRLFESEKQQQTYTKEAAEVCSKNLNIYWAKIQDLHTKMDTLISTKLDAETQKAISDIQNHLVEKIILGDTSV